jgi:alpha-galactosidase
MFMNHASRLQEQILGCTPHAVLSDGLAPDPGLVRVEGAWIGGRARFRLTNASSTAVSVNEVVVVDIKHGLPASTPIFGEGFQKLAMTGGTLGEPLDLGSYTDRGHCGIPEPEGLRTAYGLLSVSPAGEDSVLVGATSCDRFITRFSFSDDRLRISFDCEDLTLDPGESWALEELMLSAAPDRATLLDRVASAIDLHHPRLKHPLPAGWSSWLCFGSDVTAPDVASNGAWIAENLPALKYVQIDDGYEPWIGDWLERGGAFGGDVQEVLSQIDRDGLIPSIWVAPFVASPQSRLLAEHPDWFVSGADGSPLDSSTVGFGGWNQAPWYVLDGTHPGAQSYLTTVFRTMREEWGVRFFKLDANYWGAIHGGTFHDPGATRIEAYRRGMEAIRRGAGDAFLLGCNHPVWPSFGLIHGSRNSNDVLPTWNMYRTVSMENNHRQWQNDRLWWNDPDTIVLSGRFDKSVIAPDGLKLDAEPVTDDEIHYHLASTFAVGGLILSSDDLPNLPPERVRMLARVAQPTGVSARYTDDSFETGEIPLESGSLYVIFNRDDEPAARTIRLPDQPLQLFDYVTDEDLGVHVGEYTDHAFRPHYGRIIRAIPLATTA